MGKVFAKRCSTAAATALFTLCFCLLGSTATASDGTYTVNTGFTPPVSTVFKEILTEVFNRLGKNIDFQEVSAERSLILVNEGTDDAECCRILNVVLGEYPNLVIVPEYVFEVHFNAFVADKSIVVTQWNDLKPWSVGTVTGWKILVKNISLVEPREFYVLDTPQAMFRMLEKGRLDVATFGYLSGIKAIHDLQLEHEISPIEKPLATRKLFMMLNKKHADLVPQIARTLAEMKADGSYDAILKRALERH